MANDTYGCTCIQCKEHFEADSEEEFCSQICVDAYNKEALAPIRTCQNCGVEVDFPFNWCDNCNLFHKDEAPKLTLRLNTYSIVSDAVDAGVQYGYNRAHKHTDTPDADHIKQAIMNAVMSELSDIIDWGNE